MALKINLVDERLQKMWRNTTGKPIYMNQAQTETVEFGPDAAFLLVGPDGSLPMDQAKKFGLVDKGEEYDETSVATRLQEAAVKSMEENNRRAMIESGHTKLGPTFAPVAELSDDDVEEHDLQIDAKAEQAKEEEGLTPEAPKPESETKATTQADTRNKAVSSPERNK